MEHDLHLMANWFSANKLLLNLSKTVAMKFWSGTNNFDLKLDGYKLPLVTSTKFLGVNIDNTLNWHTHVNQLIKRLNTNK